MARKKTTAAKPKKKGPFNIKPYLLAAGLLMAALTVYLGYRLQIASTRLISVSVVAMIAGVLFESRRLAGNWKTVGWKFLGAYALSFFAFMPGKFENYNVEFHLQAWPYVFLFIFIIISIIVHTDKVTTKLTEGITMMQSMAVIYWVIDDGWIDTNSMFLRSLMITGSLLALFSIVHAFTPIILSRPNRLVLSIWSSIIMLLFALDNIYRIVWQEQTERASELSQALYMVLQYFLLGVSGVYIVQNLLMLTGFLPEKGQAGTARYLRQVRELRDEHINRYSDRQVSVFQALFCVLFTGTVFVLNYFYQFLPRNTAIWVVFVAFPFILMMYGRIAGSADPGQQADKQ